MLKFWRQNDKSQSSVYNSVYCDASGFFLTLKLRKTVIFWRTNVTFLCDQITKWTLPRIQRVKNQQTGSWEATQNTAATCHIPHFSIIAHTLMTAVHARHQVASAAAVSDGDDHVTDGKRAENGVEQQSDTNYRKVSVFGQQVTGQVTWAHQSWRIAQGGLRVSWISVELNRKGHWWQLTADKPTLIIKAITHLLVNRINEIH